MAMKVGQIASGVALILIGLFVGMTLFESLYTPTESAVSDLNETLYGDDYTSEADVVIQTWKLYLLAIPIGMMAGGVVFIVKSFSGV